MLFAIKNREDLEELASPKDRVEEVRLQDRLGKQNYHHNTTKLFEPLTDAIKKHQDITNTMTETSIRNNKALEDLNEKLLEILNDRGIMTSYLLSPLSEITNLENISQFKLVKDSTSNRVNDLLIHNTIPITLYKNLLTFRDTCKEFELKGDLLKKITNKNYNVDLASW